MKKPVTPKQALRRAMQAPPPADCPKPPTKAPKVVGKPTVATKKAAKPARAAKKQDAADVDRAASEGMGQPQGRPAKKRKK